RSVGLLVPALVQRGGAGAGRLPERLYEPALLAVAGVGAAVERAGEVGDEVDLLGRDGGVDDRAVAGVAEVGLGVVAGGVVVPARRAGHDEAEDDEQGEALHAISWRAKRT